MKTIESELRKDITMIKNFDIEPNFASLASKYGMDYRTIKKYYNGYQGKPATHNKPSSLDAHYNLIKEKINYTDCRISSLYFYLKRENIYEGSYSNLTYYIRKDPEIRQSNKKDNINVRYETSMGEQIQFDWVENITMINKYGEVFNFNIFSASLSYSILL